MYPLANNNECSVNKQIIQDSKASALVSAVDKVGIIRQVEVDVEAKLDQQRGVLKTESHSLKQWRRKADELAHQITERDGKSVVVTTGQVGFACRVQCEVLYMQALLQMISLWKTWSSMWKRMFRNWRWA